MIFSRLELLSGLIQETECTVAGQSVALMDGVFSIHRLLEENKKNKGKTFVVGNGGSAGIASHHAVDLVNVAKVAAIPLVEPGLLSCMGNDYGYALSFSRPLEVMIQSSDLLVAISSSGRSQNILNACEMARSKGAKVVSFSGFRADNPLRKLGDVNVWTGKEDYGLVETAHFFILHTLIDSWGKNI